MRDKRRLWMRADDEERRDGERLFLFGRFIRPLVSLLLALCSGSLAHWGTPTRAAMLLDDEIDRGWSE